MNYTLIKNKPCRIMWCHRDPSLRKSGTGNVFIKNLDKSIDNKALYDTFSAFGNILSCKVATDESGASKGYGFVRFFVSRKDRSTDENEKAFTNVFIKNLPVEWEDTELNELFAECGTIKSSVVMKAADGKSKGFAFVNYETHEKAAKAVEELNGKEVNGKAIFVGAAQKKRDRERELREKFEALKA